MVELALEQLARRGIVELDPERQAAMVSNLLVDRVGSSPRTPERDLRAVEYAEPGDGRLLERASAAR